MTTHTELHPLAGRRIDCPLPTLEWPDDNPPPHWWGIDDKGRITKVYRTYKDYCDD